MIVWRDLFCVILLLEVLALVWVPSYLRDLMIGIYCMHCMYVCITIMHVHILSVKMEKSIYSHIEYMCTYEVF